MQTEECNDENHCVICSESNLEQWHTLECEHGFHTTCIMQWFRQGASDTCPLCRESGEGEGLYIMDIHTRASFLRQKARRKDAPKDLVRMVHTLRKKEEKERETRKEYREFRTTHRDLFKEYRRLRIKKWRTWKQMRTQKRKLGLYSNPKITVPLLVPTNLRRRRRHPL